MGKMAPKGDSSKKLEPRKNPQNIPAPNSTLQLRNENTNESSSDLEEYLVKGKVDPREKRPKGKKEVIVEEDTPLGLYHI